MYAHTHYRDLRYHRAMSTLPRTTPRSSGIASRGIIDFLAGMSDANIELHSLMLARHGAVAAEGWFAPYTRDTPHLLYSLSKSFTSVAAGIAESEGLLTMDDTLRSHLPEAESYGEATIADALRMSVGHLTDPVLDPSLDSAGTDDHSLLSALRDYAPERRPGEVFTYDQLATFAAAKIVERAAGTTLLDYLRPRLFDPLGAAEARWAGNPGSLGFSGLYLTTESILAFGQLLLQKGIWEGQRLIPEGWLERATSVRMPNDSSHRFPPDQFVEADSAQGYGYQFWIGQHGYHAGGAFSQLCLVLPDEDTVIAITASAPEGQIIFDALWEHVLPALGSPQTSESADAQLEAILASASVPPPRPGLPRLASAMGRQRLGMLAGLVAGLRPEGTDAGWQSALARAEEWANAVPTGIGAIGALSDTPPGEGSPQRFRRAPHDPSLPQVRFGGIGGCDVPELTEVELRPGQIVLTLAGTPVRLAVSADRWRYGLLPGHIDIPVTTRGGWSPDGGFEAELRIIEGPHAGYLRLEPSSAEFTFVWREPTLNGTGLDGYRV